MYSRNRAVHSDTRYAENVPSVYGGSRFYRQEPVGLPAEIRTEDLRAAGADGIPVQYEVPPEIPAAEPIWEESAEECSCLPEEEPTETACTEKPPQKPEGFLSSVFADPEELLLLGLLLLFCLESERCVDVIVILLLLLIIH